MAGSWNWPKLINKIATDVPFIAEALKALLKRDPTSISDIPEGAKRLTEISAGKWQEQIYNGASWEPLGKLMHDVDTLDGYNAAITPQANTVAVRNKNGLLEDSITGNAASSDVAGTLSQTLPVNKGGTGATTSAAARTNLGVPPTSHTSSSTTYGLATDTKYGHVRSDGTTTKIVTGEVVVKDVALGGDSADPATGRGFFYDAYAPEYNGKAEAITDFDQLTIPGNYHVSFSDTTLNAPDGLVFNSRGFNDGYVEVFRISPAATISSYARIGQRLTVYGGNGFTAERVQGVSGTAFHPWRRLIDDGDVATASAAGISKPDGKTITADDGVVSAADVLVGRDLASERGYLVDNYLPWWGGSADAGEDIADLNALTKPGRYHIRISKTTQNAPDIGGLSYLDGHIEILRVYSSTFVTSYSRYEQRITFMANSALRGKTVIRQQSWNESGVWLPWLYLLDSRDAASLLSPGDIIFSLASSKDGCLLCNGATPSRTTYADLFAAIGTKFGEGDGKTTFGIPDARGKFFEGLPRGQAIGKIYSDGLPNVTGAAPFAPYSTNTSVGTFSGALYQIATGLSVTAPPGSDQWKRLGLDLSRGNSIYGASTRVQPAAVCANAFIKY